MFSGLEKTPASRIYIHLAKVQHQNNATDCGLHAVANLTEKLFGHDPEKASYDPDVMRAHLHRCLVMKKLEVFPKVKDTKRRSRTRNRLTWFQVCGYS